MGKNLLDDDSFDTHATTIKFNFQYNYVAGPFIIIMQFANHLCNVQNNLNIYYKMSTSNCK